MKTGYKRGVVRPEVLCHAHNMCTIDAMSQTTIQHNVYHKWYVSDCWVVSSGSFYDRTTTLRAIARNHRRLDCKRRKQGVSLSFGRKLPLAAELRPLGRKQWVFVALLCVGDRSPKTAVTGIRSSYCVYFHVKRLCSYCFVQNSSSACSFGCLFVIFLIDVLTAIFFICQIILARAILAWPPPIYTMHARLSW